MSQQNNSDEQISSHGPVDHRPDDDTKTQVGVQEENDSVLENLSLLMSKVQVWFSDLCELLEAESQYVVASLVALFVLSLVFALTVFLALLSLLTLIGLLLISLFALEPLHLAAVILLATSLFALSIAYLIKKVSKSFFLPATTGQIRSIFSDNASKAKENSA